MKEVSALSPTYEPIEWLKTFLIVKLFFKIKIKSPNIRWNLYIYINLYLLTFNYYNICFPSQSCIPIFFSYKSYRRPLLFANQLQCLLLLLLLIEPKGILYHPGEELKIFFWSGGQLPWSCMHETHGKDVTTLRPWRQLKQLSRGVVGKGDDWKEIVGNDDLSRSREHKKVAWKRNSTGGWKKGEILGKEKQKSGAGEVERENQELCADCLEEDTTHLKRR